MKTISRRDCGQEREERTMGWMNCHMGSDLQHEDCTSYSDLLANAFKSTDFHFIISMTALNF